MKRIINYILTSSIYSIASPILFRLQGRHAAERWNYKSNKPTTDTNIDLFLDEIALVCKRHGYSITHEDEHGNFKIVEYDDLLADWLKDADLGRNG